jgi:hypothetical protein
VTADDGNGGTVSDSFTWVANNVAPEISNLGAATGSSSCEVVLSFGVTGPSVDTEQVHIDWGYQADSDTFSASGGTFHTVTHFYTTSENFTISVSVTDDDGSTDNDSVQWDPVTCS